MTIETPIPHVHTLNDETLLSLCIQYAKDYATEYAESEAYSQLPIIMPRHEWETVWDFAWKTAWDYITEGLTPNQLYPLAGDSTGSSISTGKCDKCHNRF